RCASRGTRPSATVGFLRPRLAALVTQCVPDVGVSTADRAGVGNCSVCHKKSGLVGHSALFASGRDA
ncbi:MAG: hypothetical protein ORN83_15500, partial [Chthoniobacteraceae bacterium]|nr:hypothetical protein [Chthoniobacteraceae bacterium]